MPSTARKRRFYYVDQNHDIHEEPDKCCEGIYHVVEASTLGEATDIAIARGLIYEKRTNNNS